HLAAEGLLQMLFHLLVGPHDVIGQVLGTLAEPAIAHVSFDRGRDPAKVASLRGFARPRFDRHCLLDWTERRLLRRLLDGCRFATGAIAAAFVRALQELLDFGVELRLIAAARSCALRWLLLRSLLWPRHDVATTGAPLR